MGNNAREQQPDERDVIAVLIAQHERIKGLFAHVRETSGEHRQQTFDELRALLAAHETGEEMVVRPVTRSKVNEKVADARNAEENEANHVLARLESMDVNGPEFADAFADFERAVLRHAEQEERQEFPKIERSTDAAMRRAMGRSLLAAELTAPTHPHPGVAGSSAAQWTVGPFASLVDHARDAIKAATPGG